MRVWACVHYQMIVFLMAWSGMALHVPLVFMGLGRSPEVHVVATAVHLFVVRLVHVALLPMLLDEFLIRCTQLCTHLMQYGGMFSFWCSVGKTKKRKYGNRCAHRLAMVVGWYDLPYSVYQVRQQGLPIYEPQLMKFSHPWKIPIVLAMFIAISDGYPFKIENKNHHYHNVRACESSACFGFSTYILRRATHIHTHMQMHASVPYEYDISRVYDHMQLHCTHTH